MIIINIYYTGKNGNAVRFAEEMISSGTVEAIRGEDGNLRYDYFLPLGGGDTVLLIDSWRDQAALDIHHGLPLMVKIAALRDKYDLHMKVERFVSDDGAPSGDEAFIRK